MRGRFYLYAGIAVSALRGAFRKRLRDVGEWMKRTGRVLVLWGEDNTPRWSIELFHRCYLADAEFHLGSHIYRGPMYGAYTNGRSLVFRLNWLAQGTGGEWKKEGGSCDFAFSTFGSPHRLENGDVWFMCDGGYGILFLSTPRSRIVFDGMDMSPRVYTFF